MTPDWLVPRRKMKLLNLGDMSTWPPEATKLLRENETLLVVDRIIESLTGGQSLSSPYNGVKNPLSNIVDIMKYEISKTFSWYEIACFHCSRMTRDEIASVYKTGLRSLSGDLLSERVMARITAGNFTIEQGELLLENNSSSVKTRQDEGVCFSNSPEHVIDTTFGNFSRYWGGEALFTHHENDIVLSKILRSIGDPVIFGFKIPLHERAKNTQRYKNNTDLVEYMIAHYLRQRRTDGVAMPPVCVPWCYTLVAGPVTPDAHITIENHIFKD
jgi:hypothetical protein